MNNKLKNKELLRDRVIEELERTHHNARVYFPNVELSDTDCERVLETLHCDLDDLDNGYTFSPLEFYQKTEKNPLVAKLKFNREYRYSKDYFLIKELVDMYGELYTYGRGGATVLPKKLSKYYGASWGINTDVVFDLSNEKLMSLLEQIQALNRVIKRLCSKGNVAYIVKDIYEMRLEEVEDTRKELLNDIKELNQSYKQSSVKGKVCDLIKTEAKHIKLSFDNHIKETLDILGSLSVLDKLIMKGN